MQKNVHETFAPDRKTKNCQMFQQFGPFFRRRSQMWQVRQVTTPDGLSQNPQHTYQHTVKG